jgi:DNA-binding MarR family transcriptional regulator
MPPAAAKAQPQQSSSNKAKRREDRLDWEELEHAPNVEGMYSFLKPPAIEPPAGESVPVESLPSVSVTRPPLRVSRLRIHYCTRAHDAHTSGEQVLLETLYSLAKDPQYGTQGAYVAVSMAELAERIGMHETNVRMNIRSLIAKKALELVALEDRKKQSARQYRIFPLDEILERRRKAGLEWVIKNRGIHFVDPKTGKPVASETLPTV